MGRGRIQFFDFDRAQRFAVSGCQHVEFGASSSADAGTWAARTWQGDDGVGGKTCDLASLKLFQEVFLQATVYCGAPAGIGAFRAATEVIEAWQAGPG
jgi:hypothetical protein